MFNFKDFVKKGLLAAVGCMADHQVILHAAGWHEKGVLDEADLSEIDAAIEAKNAAQLAEVGETEETERGDEA